MLVTKLQCVGLRCVTSTHCFCGEREIMPTKRLSVSVLVCLGTILTLGVGRAYADTVTFNNSASHPGGLVTVGNTVTLANGAIDDVARINPLVAGAITGTCGPSGGATFGCIQVTTGAFVGPITTTGSNDYAYMGAGSSLTVVGGIPSLGIPAGTALFTGLFDPNSNVVLQFDDTCQSAPTQCTGSITGTLAPGLLNSVLAAAFGVSPNTLGGNDQNLFVNFTGVSFPTSGFPTGSGPGNTNQLQVVTPAVAAVPEPTSMLLLGSGLLFTVRLVRRRSHGK